MDHAATVASLDTVRLLIERVGGARDGDAVARASFAHDTGRWPDRVEVARFLLDQGYPVDAFHRSNESVDMIGEQNALHFAIWSGKEDMVRLLLERGASKTLPTRSIMKTQGETLSPLELARKYGHANIVELLQDADAAASG